MYVLLVPSETVTVPVLELIATVTITVLPVATAEEKLALASVVPAVLLVPVAIFVGVPMPSAKASEAVNPEAAPLASISRFAPKQAGVQSHEVCRSPQASAVTVQAEGWPARAPVPVLITSRSTVSPGWKPPAVMVAVWPGE